MKPPASPERFAAVRALCAQFDWLDATPSTNDDAAAAARAGAADFTVFATENQTAGRGRLGRTWAATSGKSLAVSVIVRPSELLAERPDALAWLPLMAGLAMARAVKAELEALLPGEDAEERAELGEPTERRRSQLKWPNDVLIDGFKVSGILTELIADANAVVIGAGVNLSLDEHDLPTLTSTSLQLVTGIAPDTERVLARYLTELIELYELFIRHSGDSEASGIRGLVLGACDTIGREVRILLPGDTELIGRAETLDESGRIIVRDAAGAAHAVAAGDVTHLRL